MHEVLVNRLGGLSLPKKSVVRLTDRPDMTLDVYRGRKTTMQQQQQQSSHATLKVITRNFISDGTYPPLRKKKRMTFGDGRYVTLNVINKETTNGV